MASYLSSRPRFPQRQNGVHHISALRLPGIQQVSDKMGAALASSGLEGEPGFVSLWHVLFIDLVEAKRVWERDFKNKRTLSPGEKRYNYSLVLTVLAGRFV